MTKTIRKRKVIVVQGQFGQFEIKLPNNAVKVTGILVTARQTYFSGG
jgi:hypothetical protein